MGLRSIPFFLGLVTFLHGEVVPGRYIVELDSEPVAARARRGRMQSPAAAAHRQRIRAEQTQMRTRLQQRRARVLESVDTVANALFVEASAEDIAAIAATPGVKRVLPVRKLHRLIDTAASLHRVPEAWNQSGGDRAGAGVKIAIIDSGIEVGHRAFGGSGLTAPEGFPRTGSAADDANTNGKIIVARSYVSLLPNRDPDASARDHVGHGTALAMIAAGSRTAAPLATMTGIAPKAWLGNYKVFGTPGYNDSTTDDAIIKAIDDAVADGMDIINLSLGVDLAPRLEDDPSVAAVERAFAAGVLVIAAAGNNGPGLNTLSSPATAPSAIAVGATTNARTFATSAEAPGVGTFIALVGNGPVPAAPVTAAMTSVAALGNDGLACSTLPANSLLNRVALIRRGSCTFETKLTNAQRAGALAALVYAAEDSPSPISMSVGTSTLPAEMIAFEAGSTLQNALAANGEITVTLRFTPGPVPVAANRTAGFSAAGPSVDFGIKPEIMAAGADIYTATQTLDTRGDMYRADGFILADGTSFSTPIVAGAAALLKSARPGLTAAQYRSLLINSAAVLSNSSTVQQTGAGLLDLSASLSSTVAVSPASLNFGYGGGDPRIARNITLTNTGTATETYFLSATPFRDQAAPSLPQSAVEVQPGASVEVPIDWSVNALAGGAYEGFVRVTAASTGIESRIPYWYAAASNTPSKIVVLSKASSGRSGSTVRDAVLFRVIDSAGVALTSVPLDITPISGGGTLRRINNYDQSAPGLHGIHVVLGFTPGPNVFRIQSGEAFADVTITAQ